MVATKNKLRFRASSVGKLMIGGISWTESDESKLNEYRQREAGTFLSKSGKILELTYSMEEHMKELIEKKNAPFELGQTAKSLIQSMWLNITYGYRKQVVTKEMLKGHLCEQDAMDLVSRVDPIRAFRSKNKKRFSNDFLTGEPDIDLSAKFDLIEDIKNCWSIETYCKVKTYPELYKAQGQAYMHLTGAKRFKLHYCLIDTPIELLIQEDKRLYFRFGGDENNPHYLEMSEQLYKNHSYGHIPDEEKVKTFEFEYDPEYIEEIKRRVEAGREYFNSLSLKQIDLS